MPAGAVSSPGGFRTPALGEDGIVMESRLFQGPAARRMMGSPLAHRLDVHRIVQIHADRHPAIVTGPEPGKDFDAPAPGADQVHEPCGLRILHQSPYMGARNSEPIR